MTYVKSIPMGILIISNNHCSQPLPLCQEERSSVLEVVYQSLQLSVIKQTVNWHNGPKMLPLECTRLKAAVFSIFALLEGPIFKV